MATIIQIEYPDSLLSNGTISNETVLLDNIPGHMNHDGARLKFGPDGKKYMQPQVMLKIITPLKILIHYQEKYYVLTLTNLYLVIIHSETMFIVMDFGIRKG